MYLGFGETVNPISLQYIIYIKYRLTEAGASKGSSLFCLHLADIGPGKACSPS